MSMKVLLFIFIGVMAIPASLFLAGAYTGLGIKSSPAGVLLGFFWMALWYGMFARGPLNPKTDKTDNERPQE